MKKTLSIALALIMVVCLAACGSGGGGGDAPDPAPAPAPAPATDPDSGAAAPSGETVSLKLAHGHAPQSVLGLQYQMFADAVEELSGGSLVIEMFPGGSLLADPETFEGAMNGVVDIAHVLSSFETGIVKDLSPLEMYGFYLGDDYMGFVEEIRPIVDEIYAPYGVMLLSSPDTGKNAIMCTTKEILSPDDMKGLTFRSAGTWYGKCIEAFGAAATQISFADMPTAFERGTVHGTIVGYNVAYPLGLHESCPYFTRTATQGYFTNMIMNLDSYNRLSPEHQDVIMRAAKVFDTEGGKFAEETIEEYRLAIIEYGCSFPDLTMEQEKVFLELADPLYDQMPDLSDNGYKLIDIIKKERAVWEAAN